MALKTTNRNIIQTLEILLGKWLARYQRSLAQMLNRRMANLSSLSMKIGLFLFMIFTTCMCGYIAIAPAHSLQTIRTSDKQANRHFIGKPVATHNRIRAHPLESLGRFRTYTDSLASAGEGRVIRDSTQVLYPYFFDSLADKLVW